MLAWKTGRSGNLMIVADAWVLSYKENGGEATGMGYGEGEDARETVLIDRGDGRRDHFVLRGDHRAEYEAVMAQGWDALKAVYDRLKGDHISFYSADYPHEDVASAHRCSH